jgi:hypothetical protein
VYIEDHIKILNNSITDLKTTIDSLSRSQKGNRNNHLDNNVIATNSYKNDELLTVTEISKLIKSNPTFVYSLIKAGLIPYLKLGSIKVRRTSLEKFLQEYEGWDITDPYNVKPLITEGNKNHGNNC